MAILNWYIYNGVFSSELGLSVYPEINCQLQGFHWAKYGSNGNRWNLSACSSLLVGCLQVMQYWYVIVNSDNPLSQVNVIDNNA